MTLKKYLLVIFILLVIPIISAPTLNNLTKPDFGTYPHLQTHHSNMPIHDFTQPNTITYYYNNIGTELVFSLKEEKVYLKVKDVAYDKESKEYATIEVNSKGMSTTYLYLYEEEPVILDLLDEQIRITANSIIDHDNIEYLTIHGLIESVKSSPQEEQPIEETIPPPTLKKQIEQPIKEEKPKIEEIPKNYTIFSDPINILLFANIFLIFIILILIFKSDKKEFK